MATRKISGGESDSESRGSLSSKNSGSSKFRLAKLLGYGSKDIEPINEEASEENLSSEEETDDEEIARENARP